MSDMTKEDAQLWLKGLKKAEEISLAAALCNALELKRCVSLKIEVDSETMIPMVTSVQYLGHDQFHALEKVLRQYRLEPISETQLPTPDVEVFLDGRVHTFRLPAHSPESDPT